MGDGACLAEPSAKRQSKTVRIQKVINGYIVVPDIFDGQLIANTLAEALELTRKAIE